MSPKENPGTFKVLACHTPFPEVVVVAVVVPPIPHEGEVYVRLALGTEA